MKIGNNVICAGCLAMTGPSWISRSVKDMDLSQNGPRKPPVFSQETQPFTHGPKIRWSLGGNVALLTSTLDHNVCNPVILKNTAIVLWCNEDSSLPLLRVPTFAVSETMVFAWGSVPPLCLRDTMYFAL